MPETTDISTVYERALGPGASPFEFQRRVAEEGFPELLDVPTGCGKTPAMMLGWLYRKLLHPDSSIREATPTRLIWCMPLRSLTRQTANLAEQWVKSLGLDDHVDVHTLMGGEPVDLFQLRMHPERPAIVLSTLDMALSRALNRGYLASRFTWPIDFALFNSDCHWVFDEVQLMGVSLTTSRQLHGLRQMFGTPKANSTTWMSATIPSESLITVDAPGISSSVEMSPADRSDPALAHRLDAPKTLVCVEVPDLSKFDAGVADIALSEHRPGSLTLVTMNTVDNARLTAAQLRKRLKETEDSPDVIVLHSRFRSADRDAILERLLGPLPQPGLIAVTTQVVEAGIDVSATTLITEAAPWSSIVQRAGRCNRTGEAVDARLIIIRQPKPFPYDLTEVEAAWSIATTLNLTTVTPSSLAEVHPEHRVSTPLTLRRKDLLDLFDTAPDLSGNDIDISRYIHEDRNIDVAIAWRDIDVSSPEWVGHPPGSTETCPVPLKAAIEFLKKSGPALVQDPLLAAKDRRKRSKTWRIAATDDIRPGVLLLFPTSAGGYTTASGFEPKSRHKVDSLAPSDPPEPRIDEADTVFDDSSSTDFEMVTLDRHLMDVEQEAVYLCQMIGGIDGTDIASVARAGRLHDLGKAHVAFQQALHDKLPENVDAVLAKSGQKGGLSYRDKDRRGFRHELASAFVLIDQPELIGDGELDPDLITYLVGAHHGRIRLGIRTLPNEPDGQILGIREGDEIDSVDLGQGLRSLPATLHLDVTQLGGREGQPSWSTRALALLDEHGPFRLAWLEMLVRIADWRASKAAESPTPSSSDTPAEQEITL